MKLDETIKMMTSPDFKERFRAEYFQLKIRIEGLASMIVKYKAGELTFKPNCSYDLLHGQYKSMELYTTYLEERAIIEDINLELVNVWYNIDIKEWVLTTSFVCNNNK